MQTDMTRKWGQQYSSDKIDFKTKAIKNDKQGHHILKKKKKGSIQKEDIILINIYAPNKGAPKYIKQALADIE